jgi:hypothetical protein
VTVYETTGLKFSYRKLGLFLLLLGLGLGLRFGCKRRAQTCDLWDENTEVGLRSGPGTLEKLSKVREGEGPLYRLLLRSRIKIVTVERKTMQKPDRLL